LIYITFNVTKLILAIGETASCHTGLIVKKLITQYMSENSFFYTVDCWRNINL